MLDGTAQVDEEALKHHPQNLGSLDETETISKMTGTRDVNQVISVVSQQTSTVDKYRSPQCSWYSFNASAETLVDISTESK